MRRMTPNATYSLAGIDHDPRMPSLLGLEAVAHAGHCLNERAGFFVELLTQPVYVRVHVRGLVSVTRTPDCVKNHLVRTRAPGSGCTMVLTIPTYHDESRSSKVPA